MPDTTILLVEDDDIARAGVRDLLVRRGYSVQEAESCESATRAFHARRPDVVLVDYRLPDGNGVDLIRRLRSSDPDVPFIILTGHGSIDLAVQAVKEGAEQFMTKPIKQELLETLVHRLLERQSGRKRTLLQQSREARDEVDPFLGQSPAIQRVAESARRMLHADSPVLLLGETGSGKGVLARWFHRNGPRGNEAFVDLNCAGLSPQFLESELFGHDRGAFTGAVSAKPGLFEMAHRGMLFLDEIGDMDRSVQPKLLKVLEEKRFRRLGEVREREVSVRLIAATHHDMRQLVIEQRFRRDLYFRIGALPLVVPPLRERTEDIPAMADDMLRRIGAELGRQDLRLSSSATTALVSYAWPGNVRELKNLLERAALLSDSHLIGARELRLHADDSQTSSSTEDVTLAELERRHIERIYNEERGHAERTAARLGIPRSSLYQKLAKMGLSRRGRSSAG